MLSLMLSLLIFTGGALVIFLGVRDGLLRRSFRGQFTHVVGSRAVAFGWFWIVLGIVGITARIVQLAGRP